MGARINRVGEKHTTYKGYEIEIIEYKNNKKIKILFTNEGYIIENVPYSQILSGFVKTPKEIKNGEQYITNEGYRVTIINFINDKSCDISFENGFVIKNRYYKDIKKGNVKNLFHKTILGVGYLGCGVYKASRDNKAYTIWINMLRRCYCEKYQEKQPTYIHATVCAEWHNFQNFAEWYENNYIEDFHLDKDILVKGNKIYSLETCCFVPQEINNLLTKRNSKRGDLPIGVYKTESKYRARLSKKGSMVTIGFFNTIEESFQAYKTAKEKYIKEVADKYKDKISKKVYQSLIDYQVEIID